MDDELSIAGSKIDGVTTGMFQDTNPLSAAPRTRPSSAPARRKSGNRMARSQPSWVTDSGKVRTAQRNHAPRPRPHNPT